MGGGGGNSVLVDLLVRSSSTKLIKSLGLIMSSVGVAGGKLALLYLQNLNVFPQET